MNMVRKLAPSFDVCIAKIVEIYSDEEVFYQNALRELQEDDKATVVITFCDGTAVTGLLQAVRRQNLIGRFLFLGRCISICI